jgi:DNA-binding MarR family transcriptional regulator
MKEHSKNTTVGDLSDIGPSCVAYRMRMLSRVISGLYDEALAPLQLKGSQLNVLATLARRGPVAPTDLCAMLRMDKSTLSRNLERMAKRGWLAVRPGEDNRTHRVELTAEGTKLLRDAYPLWRKAQVKAARRMGEEGVAALNTLTKKLSG